jgi:hypothetical protein
MLASMTTPTAPRVRGTAARTPVDTISLDMTTTPSRGLGSDQEDGGAPEISGDNFKILMDKIRDLERDRDAVRDKQDIVGVIAAGQNQVNQILADRNKRERSEKEASDEPVLIKMSGLSYEDDNHSVLCWQARRLYKQPNCNPSTYWKDALYVTEVKPNLREALYLDHILPLSISPKALGWAHNLKTAVNIKFFAHSQSTGGKKRKSNVSIEESNDRMEARAISLSTDWLETGSVMEVMEALHNWTAVR